MRCKAAITATKIAQRIVHITIVVLDQQTLFVIIYFNGLSTPPSPVPGLQVVDTVTETLIFGEESVKPKSQNLKLER